MAKEYRDISIEEEEPLTGEVGVARTFRSSGKNYPANRLRFLGSRPGWVAHGILLSVSIASLALSVFIRATTPSNSTPFTYCSFNWPTGFLLEE